MIHKADVPEAQLQRCELCGEILIDHRYTLAVGDAAPRWWTVGAWIRVTPGESVRLVEAEILAAPLTDFCGALVLHQEPSLAPPPPLPAWSCAACDGTGQDHYTYPCLRCGSTGIAWPWLRPLVKLWGEVKWRAHTCRCWARRRTRTMRCADCRRLTWLVGRRVGNHNGCVPF